ncbi:hypothetical protein SAMN05421503_1440 [Terribacillus aidingensis]|uniref:Bacillus phage SPbeta YonK domain-containing protein n=1 Tax=Terribacillus aidingensis TaxID=586416 RepID=A0A285NKB5_9BACI|nr:YonK family protein [Terribacillus aidingensis]SNZ09964.1 hypothetical protein SAMN05421503_1440 [Terribacillus aidingensis]
MAKQNITQTFKKAKIDLEAGTLTEYDDEIKVYQLEEILDAFEGENRMIDITIKEASELENYKLDSSID